MDRQQGPCTPTPVQSAFPSTALGSPIWWGTWSPQQGAVGAVKSLTTQTIPSSHDSSYIIDQLKSLRRKLEITLMASTAMIQQHSDGFKTSRVLQGGTSAQISILQLPEMCSLNRKPPSFVRNQWNAGVIVWKVKNN